MEPLDIVFNCAVLRSGKEYEYRISIVDRGRISKARGTGATINDCLAGAKALAEQLWPRNVADSAEVQS